MIKLQMLGQMGNQPKEQQTPMMMFYQLLFMGFMSVIEDIVKAIPKMFENAKLYIFVYFRSRVKQTIESKPKTLHDVSVQLNTKHFQNIVTMSRVFQTSTDQKTSSQSEESNNMIDAVLEQISKLTNVPTLQLIDRGQIMITYKDKPIQMTKDIFFKVENIHINDAGVIASIKFMLTSNTLSAADIALYATTLYKNYLQERNNSLGNNIYYFDQKQKDSGPPALPVTSDNTAINNHKRMLIMSAPKILSYIMAPFYSNKQFSNIYGEQARLVEKRLRFFIENKEWYDSKGIPYQLGMLLSGVPGSGKSSLIKAVANITKRHIVNVNFANIKTATQLKNLFYSDRIQVYTDTNLSNSQSYFIPIEKRLYVLEEIDAIGSIVKQRTGEDSNDANSIIDEMNLMEILTVLDGTMEIPGRILIMTTNHPEVLDDALIRPGRIDMQVHFDYAKRELIVEMYEGYMDQIFPIDKIHRLPDILLTPAEVGQVLFRHFSIENCVEDVINDLVKTACENLKKRRGYVEKLSEIITEELIEKPKEELIEKPKEEIIEKSKEEIIEKPKEEIIEKSTIELMKQSKIELIEKPTEKIIEKPKEEIIEKSTIELMEKSKLELIEKSKISDNLLKNNTIKNDIKFDAAFFDSHNESCKMTQNDASDNFGFEPANNETSTYSIY